jgi:hypothetical protein
MSSMFRTGHTIPSCASSGFLVWNRPDYFAATARPSRARVWVMEVVNASPLRWRAHEPFITGLKHFTGTFRSLLQMYKAAFTRP